MHEQGLHRRQGQVSEEAEDSAYTLRGDEGVVGYDDVCIALGASGCGSYLLLFAQFPSSSQSAAAQEQVLLDNTAV